MLDHELRTAEIVSATEPTVGCPLRRRRKQRSRPNVLRVVWILVKARQFVAITSHREHRGGEHGADGREFFISHLSRVSERAGYGVIRKLRPTVRALGRAANSIPWKFPTV